MGWRSSTPTGSLNYRESYGMYMQQVVVQQRVAAGETFITQDHARFSEVDAGLDPVWRAISTRCATGAMLAITSKCNG